MDNERQDTELTKVEMDYILQYEKHLENTQQAAKYSIERFDILITTLSSGGLALSISFVKELPDNPCANIIFLKIACTFFALALILSLISQVTAYEANQAEINIVKKFLNKKKKNTSLTFNAFLKENLVIERKKILNNKATLILNRICLIVFIFAVISVIIFMYQTI